MYNGKGVTRIVLHIHKYPLIEFYKDKEDTEFT